VISDTKPVWSSALAAYGLCGVLALVPLPFASVQTGAIAVWTALLAIIAIFGHGGETSSRDTLFVSAFAALACGWLAVVILQVVPLPARPDLIHPIWPQTGKMADIGAPGLIAATRNQPFYSAGAQIACALALMCGYFAGRQRWSARLLLKVFSVSGLVYAAYGIAAFLVAPDYVLWLEKVAYRNVLTSTFINANTAAVYFGACATGWLMLLLESAHRGSSPAERHWRDIDLRHPSGRTLFYFLAFVVVLSATFMTGSRLGTALTLVVLCGAAATFYRRSLTSWSAVTKGLLISIALAIVLFQLLGGRVNQRVDVVGLTDDMRLQTYISTLRIIEEFPWLGTGLGTFRWVYPQYRSGDMSVSGIWDRAHSTPLELAAEMGLPFTIVVIMAWALTIGLLARGMMTRNRDDILPTCAFWISLLALLHSMMDFSLQIPGFAIAVLILIGMGLAQSFSSKRAATFLTSAAAGLAKRATLN
jgi:hypothetical protein